MLRFKITLSRASTRPKDWLLCFGQDSWATIPRFRSRTSTWRQDRMRSNMSWRLLSTCRGSISRGMSLTLSLRTDTFIGTIVIFVHLWRPYCTTITTTSTRSQIYYKRHSNGTELFWLTALLFLTMQMRLYWNNYHSFNSSTSWLMNTCRWRSVDKSTLRSTM
jgi:hypothetical protein